MQTKNLKKKGFTLVELVVVVAVIAVLSAILIPTIGCFVEQAKETNDMATVRLLNTALVEDEAANGKSATMTDALAAMAKKGYLVDRLTPRSTGEILWDSTNNRFALYKDGQALYRDNTTEEIKGANLWKVVDTEGKTVEQIQAELTKGEYSYYLKGNSVAGTFNVSTGLDVGENTGITAVRYTGAAPAKTVVIRTNGGKLVVDAANDTVNHHGEAQNVDIKNVDLHNSYHEFGEVGYVEIAKGHFVAEANSVVITLVNTGAATEVKLDAAASADVKIAFTTNESAKESAHGGNLALTYKNLTEDEKNELIYNAEAQAMNAIAVNGKYYKSMSDVFDRVAIRNGDGYDVNGDVTITLYKDIEDKGVIVKTATNLVFDLNGHTYSVNGTVGSVGTTTIGFQLLRDSTITFKNGILKSSKAYMLIQNYSNLTLDNMIIDGTELDGNITYALSNNNGITVINNTTINAKESGCAFDVYSFKPYTGGNVTIKGESVINGRIEIGRDANASVENMALIFESGIFNSTLDISKEELISKVSKKEGLTINLPSGYTWSETEDGYQKLVKAN